MTDEELTALGFIGESEPFVITHVHSSLILPFDLLDAPSSVKNMVEAVKANPVYLGSQFSYVLLRVFHLSFTATFFVVRRDLLYGRVHQTLRSQGYPTRRRD